MTNLEWLPIAMDGYSTRCSLYDVVRRSGRWKAYYYADWNQEGDSCECIFVGDDPDEAMIECWLHNNEPRQPPLIPRPAPKTWVQKLWDAL